MSNFILKSSYSPSGDQPNAINSLVNGIENNEKYQTLEGVTGSGKTFTVANVISKVKRPSLVLAHNKTLAAQLYTELKEYFPENLVEYFVSYYDYYQPEAYIPVTNTYIEKDLSINDEIEKLRLSTTSSLLSGRDEHSPPATGRRQGPSDGQPRPGVRSDPHGVAPHLPMAPSEP